MFRKVIDTSTVSCFFDLHCIRTTMTIMTVKPMMLMKDRNDMILMKLKTVKMMMMMTGFTIITAAVQT